MSPNDFKSMHWEYISPTMIAFPEGLTPRDYLQFAIDDLGSSSDRERINSVSNAKKALHLQLATISDALGYKDKKDKFPTKLEFCNACGVVGSRILRRLNRLRNDVEHDYVIPTKEQAEDYIDIVELFLAATNGLLIAFPEEYNLSGDDFGVVPFTTSYLETRWQPHSGEINLKGRLLKIPEDELHDKAAKQKSVLLASGSREANEELKRRAYSAVIGDNSEKFERIVTVSQRAEYCVWAAFIIRGSGRVF
jgi:hypothetical protein